MAENNGAATAEARDPVDQEERASARQQRLEELRARFNRGEYRVDSHELAARIVHAHLRPARDE
jgi:anti-sigma28 factor (negative regulator of flagellin synthesis)